MKSLGVIRVKGDLCRKTVDLTIQRSESDPGKKVLDRLKSIGHEVKGHSINVAD